MKRKDRQRLLDKAERLHRKGLLSDNVYRVVARNIRHPDQVNELGRWWARRVVENTPEEE